MLRSLFSITKERLIFIIPSIVVIAVFAGSIFFFLLPRVRELGIQQKKTEIRNLVDLPLRICAWYESRAASGTMDGEEARRKAAEVIESLRYGEDNKDYFWIVNTEPLLVMHPYREELEGQPVGGYTDKEGNQVFAEMVDTVRERGSGFVTYYWQVRDEEEETGRKLSFVSVFEPWGWIIGTGMYLGEFDRELALMTRSMLFVLLAVALLIAGILGFMVRSGIAVQQGRRFVADELAKSRYYYRQLVELMEEGIAVQDSGGRFTYVNRQFCSMLGYTAQELLHAPVIDFLDEASREVYRRELQEHREGRVRSYNAEWKTADGSRLATIVSPRVLQDGQGRYDGSFAVITNITELTYSEEELSSLLQEKTVLLKEIHHRVKNNLQVIASLFNLQFQNTQDETTKHVLYDSQLRIQTISRVHEFLYESENLRDIDMRAFLEQLVLDVQAVYSSSGSSEISFDLAVDTILLPVDKAVPIGLIMNELVSNALKHAFPPDYVPASGKKVTLFLHAAEHGVVFGVDDNGRGLPPDILQRRSVTLGVELINVLTEQLRGAISFGKGSAGSGSRVEIRLSA
jgi:PAS domain S-box-containing protein